MKRHTFHLLYISTCVLCSNMVQTVALHAVSRDKTRVLCDIHNCICAALCIRCFVTNMYCRDCGETNIWRYDRF
jgi:hypothetical protein